MYIGNKQQQYEVIITSVNSLLYSEIIVRAYSSRRITGHLYTQKTATTNVQRVGRNYGMYNNLFLYKQF